MAEQVFLTMLVMGAVLILGAVVALAIFACWELIQHLRRNREARISFFIVVVVVALMTPYPILKACEAIRAENERLQHGPRG